MGRNKDTPKTNPVDRGFSGAYARCRANPSVTRKPRPIQLSPQTERLICKLTSHMANFRFFLLTLESALYPCGSEGRGDLSSFTLATSENFDSPFVREQKERADTSMAR